MESEIKLDNSLKTMVQTIGKHQQAQRFDGIYPLTTKEIAKAQKKDHQIYSKIHARTSKVDLLFQLIEGIIVLYKDENQSSQHLYG
jgi:hypothetical protein